MDAHAGSRNFYPEVTYINPAHLLIKDRTNFKGDGSETAERNTNHCNIQPSTNLYYKLERWSRK